VYPALLEVPFAAYLVHSCTRDACSPSDAMSFQGSQQQCFDAACKLLDTVIPTGNSAAYFWCADCEGCIIPFMHS
jgi:hypothetical protein